MVRVTNFTFIGLIFLMLLAGVARAQESPLEKAKSAFEKGEHPALHPGDAVRRTQGV